MRSVSQSIAKAFENINNTIGRLRACIVDSSGNEITTFPVSGTITAGVEGLKLLGDGVTSSISNTATEVAVTSGAELCSVENQGTGDMYVGTTSSQRATGIKISSGVIRHNIPVTGLENIYIHSTVDSQNAGIQFYGRS